MSDELLSSPSPQNPNLDIKISPSILLIIIILAVILFVSGLLHLLVRCLLRPTTRIRNTDPDPTTHQGQLRQLFHLHDGGVDQSFIDTLPVFPYKAILGLKDPFDCAVCLCEFESEDKLRLLPKCSHAFHVDCIDTWLLSHSTCPLCRSGLLNGDNIIHPFPFVCVLESSRSMAESVPEPDSHTGMEGELGFGVGSDRALGSDEDGRILTVKLGMFRNVDGGEGCSLDNNTNNNNKNNSNKNDLGCRRCYSMGSFAYVLDETSTSLQVPIRTPAKKLSCKKPTLPLKPGCSTAMSEYCSDSMREFNRNENESGRGKKEGFSISKIWMRGNESSRRTISEIEVNQSELGVQSQRFIGDDESRSCYSVDSLVNQTSSSSTSNKITLLWLMGRHNNKVVHNHSSSFSSNV